jgi:hypothetical protein
MSKSEPAGWRRVPIQLAVAAAVVTGAGGALAGAAIADDDSDRTVELPAAGANRTPYTPYTPTPISARERARLLAIVAKMPSGWPATEVMRQAAAAERSPDAHQDWRRAVELMPTGWAATEVIRQAAAESAG